MIDRDEIVAARDRIDDLARVTPIERSRTFSEMTGADLHLKLEVFQRTGAFKIRGAANRIRTLDAAERERGVITASAGNHAQGVALAATASDVDSIVVMPRDAPVAKVDATQGYGASVVLEGDNYDEAQAVARELAAEEGRTYIPAFDDPQVMAGQGTIGLEILDALPTVETIVVPVGGGGLIGGIARAVKTTRDDVRVIGVQAAGAASLPQSLERGHIYERETVDTIADGIATKRVGDLPFEVIQAHVDEVVTVADEEIAMAVTHLLERSKLVAEGAGAAGLAAVLGDRFSFEPEETVVPVISGGNIDLNMLTTVILRGLVETGRYLRFRTVLRDRPGELERLSTLLAEEHANIYAIRHERTSRNVAMNDAEVELDLETRGHAHVASLLDALRDAGYPVEILS